MSVTSTKLEGVIKTVRASDAEMWTSQGWVVVGSFQDTEIKQLHEIVSGTSSDYGGTYYDHNGLIQTVPCGKTLAYHYLAVTATYLLLQQDTNSALASATASLAVYEKKLREEKESRDKTINAAYTRQQNELSAALAKHKEELAALNKKLKSSEDSLAAMSGGSELKALKKTFDVERKDLQNSINALEIECAGFREQLDVMRSTKGQSDGVRRVDWESD